MNEIHPSLVADPSLLPQLLHREPERFRRSFMVRCPLFSLRIREERLVKILRKVSPVLVHHSPHYADHAPESGVRIRPRMVCSLQESRGTQIGQIGGAGSHREPLQVLLLLK